MAPENSQLLTIGIDFGGTNLRVAAYTPALGVLNSIALSTRLEAGPHAVVDDMCDAILDLLGQYSDSYALAGIGVGSPAPSNYLRVGFIIRPTCQAGMAFTCLLKSSRDCECR